MKVKFHEGAWEEYLYWQQTSKATLKRINQLIRDIQRSPFEGIGKPEPLRGCEKIDFHDCKSLKS